MNINWLGTYETNGIAFHKGDNGEHLFYDAEAGGIYWCVLRPHISVPILPGTKPPEDGRCHIPYWFAYAEQGGALKPLNLLHRDLGGTEYKDPLCDSTDSGYEDPPTRLLAAIAELIIQQANPWNLERIKVVHKENA